MGELRTPWRAPLLALSSLSLVLAGAGSAAAVVGGSDAGDQFSFVARLALGNSERACSGVLVDPRAVLTSAACFAGAGGAVHSGPPEPATTVTVGLGGTGGVTTTVTDIVVHPDRDLVLGRLRTPITSIDPVTISATAPAAGDELTLAGSGRTATEWVPDRSKVAGFRVDTVGSATFEVVPRDAATVGICKGDAGGPALRQSGGQFQLVALHLASNQAGCLGQAAGAPRATETRVDDVRPWMLGNLPGFATGVESGDAWPNWVNTVAEGGGVSNVGGVCCSLPGPELFVGPNPAGAHGGAAALMYSGRDLNASSSYAYLKAFDLSSLPVRAGTVLSYWIFPQSKASSWGYADGNNSMCVAVDLRYTDNSSLRDSTVRDQRGNLAHPAGQCGKLTLDSWNEVIVPIGTVAAGKRIATLSIGYDQPANTGGYRGYVDDIMISEDGFASGVEAGQTGPTSVNTVSVGVPRGGLVDVGGVCCDLTGPELFIGSNEAGAHGGAKVLMYSGRDNSATRSFAYARVFDLSGVYVTPTSRLSYWVFPQSKAASWGYADGNNSTCVAIDLIFADSRSGAETNLRDSGAVDQRGMRAHPAHQCGKLTLDTWNYVSVPLGAVATGERIVQLDIGYDQPANVGGYRGYVDDIRISQ